MRRAVSVILLSVMLCFLCSGCDAWTGGEYLSVTPHEAQPEDYTDRVIEVASYTQLRNAVANLVRTGATDGIISISAFNKGTIHFYVDTAISNVIENTAYGSYAVEKITYEIGTNRGDSVVACKVHYRSGYKPPSEIKEIGSADALSNAVIQALEDLDGSILVRMEQYEKLDIERIVENYASAYPDHVLEIPKLAISVYPEKGAERIIEIVFQYQTDVVLLRQMQGKVEERFRAAEESVRGLENAEAIYEQLYLYLKGCYQPGNRSITPVYDLLVNGGGDDKVLADVYTRLCTRIGLGCKTIVGTREGQERSWNAIQLRGKFYEVDLLECIEKQEFRLLTDEQLKVYQAS